tara:strand:+ start:15367 stop:16059 length:693 start_codon:yes stop_codon:yes gene_type:complete
MALSAIVGAGMSAVGGLIQGFGARKAARRARRRAKKLNAQLKKLVANRQEVINPADNVIDRSGMIQNNYSNLQVATGAAEMQAEEADISLANTLDTLRATGAGAGGATALAQAALRSKKGVAATIEKQEAQNTLARAKGADVAQQARLAEGGRVDAARMQGAAFEFSAQETRQFRDEDRIAGQLDNARQAAAQASAQARAGFGQALGAVGGVAAGALIGGDKFKEALKKW